MWSARREFPDKTATILNMKLTSNVSELRRFIGMVNQVGKFSPRVYSRSEPLRELLSTMRQWMWEQSQERAFAQVKEELLQLCMTHMPMQKFQQMPLRMA